MPEGWVKLHHQTLDSQVWCNADLFKVWTWCLLKASHKDTWVSMRTGRGSTELKLSAGQFVFGRKSAASELRMKATSVYARMKKLQNMKNLDIQPDRHWSIVTICNWSTYQSVPEMAGHPTGHPTDTQPTGNRQATDNQMTQTRSNTLSLGAQSGIDFLPEYSTSTAPSTENYEPRAFAHTYVQNFPDGQGGVDWITLQHDFSNRWNARPGVVRSKRLLTSIELRLLVERLRDPEWRFEEAMEKIPCRQFGEWKPDLEWFLTEGRVHKILEEKYDHEFGGGKRNGVKINAGEIHDPNRPLDPHAWD